MFFRTAVFVLSAVVIISSCKSNKILVEETRYSADSTKTILTFQGRKKELIKEVTYSPAGNLKSEFTFQDSVLNGSWKIFYDNGMPKQEGVFENGVENGLSRYYNQKGVCVFEGILSKGMKEGTWTSWYDEVSKQEEREYKSDVLNGKWTHWYIDGNLMKEEFFENGKKVKEVNYE